jgi:hypothetical protein
VPVEPLVVVEDEPADGLGEPAELAEELVAPLGVTIDDRELLVVEGAWLLQDLVRDRELADVVQQPTCGERAKLVRGEAELLADEHGPQGHSARMTLRVLVLLGQAHGQGADAGAEERLLGLDELARSRPAGQRARGLRPAEIHGYRDPHQQDAQQLERMAEPPAELHVVEHEGGDEAGREEGEPDDHEQVGAPAREEEGVDRPDLGRRRAEGRSREA